LYTLITSKFGFEKARGLSGRKLPNIKKIWQVTNAPSTAAVLSLEKSLLLLTKTQVHHLLSQAQEHLAVLAVLSFLKLLFRKSCSLDTHYELLQVFSFHRAKRQE